MTDSHQAVADVEAVAGRNIFGSKATTIAAALFVIGVLDAGRLWVGVQINRRNWLHRNFSRQNVIAVHDESTVVVPHLDRAAARLTLSAHRGWLRQLATWPATGKQFSAGTGPTQVVALRQMATHLFQYRELLVRFDALVGSHTDSVGKLDTAAHDGRIAIVGPESGDKTTVDLELIDGNCLRYVRLE